MQDFPPWVAATSDAALADRFGPDTAGRGLAYAREGRVEGVRLAGDLVTGAVRGSHQAIYHAAVTRRPGGDLGGSCTCPVRFDCKHVVAVLAHARDAGPQRPVAAWQHLLGPLLDRPAHGRGVPLALQLSLHEGRVLLRAYRQGARDNWIKSGASWSDMRLAVETGGLDPAQLAALKALADAEAPTYYRYSTDALQLNDLGPDAWRHLRRAVEAGVTLLPANDLRDPALLPVLREDAAEPVIALERGAAGGIVVRPSFVLGDETLRADEVAVIGRPGHGLALRRADELWLVPLSRPLTAKEGNLFAGRGSTTVPDADVPLFATGFLPQLRRRITVRVADGLELPEAHPPRLTCRVSFGDASASVDWGFRYAVGDATYDLTIEPRAGDPPVRMAAEEAALASSVPAGPWTRRRLDGSTALQPALLDGRPLFDFVARVLPGLRARDDVVVLLAEEPPDYRRRTEAPHVEVSVTDSEAGDWFNLGVSVTVGGEEVPLAQLLAALTAGDDHVVLETGSWFELDRPEFEQLRALVAEARTLGDSDEGDLRLRPEHAGLWEELVSLGVVAEQSASWRTAVGALLDLDKLPAVPVPAGLTATLRPYQETGFHWLSFLRRTRLGGVLADEMGLGKTLQTLALIQAAHEAGELDHPVLVVAPTSVIPTWVAEAARFAPGLEVLAVPGTQRRRGVPLPDAVGSAHVVVTSYTLLRLEAEAYAALPWSLVLLDEAQFVKNRASQVYKAVRRLRARTKVALTGTPLENNLMDLWSILSIVAPGLFPDPRAFTELYRRPIESGDAAALARLHRRIRPLLLRRTKADVASELPPKQEQVVPVELSAAHRRVYDRHLTRERQRVLGLVGDLNRNRITILRSLTLLRQLALSPALVDTDGPAESAKIDTLIEWLTELASEGHRALVFSQFTGYLALVRDRLARAGISTEYLDGRTRDRAARIDAFRTGEATAFLISLKAGGFGLTLVEADYVFILDPWWNPAAETQAIDRTHRIGQDKPVNVYRLVSVDTIEEKVVALQQRKRDLFDQVMGSDADLAAPLTADEIRGLLAP